MNLIKINIGINRRLPPVGNKRGRIEHKNIMGVEFECDNDLPDYTLVRAYIALKHPGWSITGYALALPSKGSVDNV